MARPRTGVLVILAMVMIPGKRRRERNHSNDRNRGSKYEDRISAFGFGILNMVFDVVKFLGVVMGFGC